VVKALAIKPEDIKGLWPHLKPYIESALEYSLHEQNAEEVKEKGISGIYLFLVFKRDTEVLGVITIETIVYPTKTIVGVIHVGGKDIDEWVELMWTTVRDLAKEQGASEVISYGRQGWIKKLKPYGFKHQYTILSAPI